jgi:predicted DNA-binding transcriptional regulator AlpA
MKLDEKATAARTGLAVKTLQNWRSAGTGPAFYKLGGRVLYDTDELDAWLAARRRTSTSDRGGANTAAARA